MHSKLAAAQGQLPSKQSLSRQQLAPPATHQRPLAPISASEANRSQVVAERPKGKARKDDTTRPEVSEVAAKKRRTEEGAAYDGMPMLEQPQPPDGLQKTISFAASRAGKAERALRSLAAVVSDEVEMAMGSAFLRCCVAAGASPVIDRLVDSVAGSCSQLADCTRKAAALVAASTSLTAYWRVTKPLAGLYIKFSDSTEQLLVALCIVCDPRCGIERRTIAGDLPRGALSDVIGNTPLYLAVTSGRADLIEALLALGADPNTRTSSEMRFTLSDASIMDDMCAIRLLIANGADVEAADTVNITALHCAAKYSSGEVIKTLIANGAPVDARTSTGSELLHYVVEGCRVSKEEKLEIMELLMAEGANVRGRDNQTMTPLHYAARWGCIPSIELLLAKGAPIEELTSYGLTPLHVASHSCNAAAIEALVAKGANIWARDKNGSLPWDYYAGWVNRCDYSRATEATIARVKALLKPDILKQSLIEEKE